MKEVRRGPVIRVEKRGGVHYFDVDHHVKQVYWLVSCNRRQPHPKACDSELWKLISRRVSNNNGGGKGRAVVMFRSGQRLVAGAIALHVGDDHTVTIHMAVHSGVTSHKLRQQVVSYLIWCARQLAAGVNAGDETFRLILEHDQADLRKFVGGLGMKVQAPPKWPPLRRPIVLVYRQSHRVEVVRSR